MEIHNHSASSLSAPSPTFTSYSSEDLGDIAARVVSELNLSISDDDFYSSLHQHDAVKQEDDKDDDDGDESEFEFAVVRRDDDSSPVSADEIFDNGQIRPMFPLFNTDLIYNGVSRDVDASEQRTIRLPLRNLLTKERESAAAASCTSSEGDDLEGIPEGTYCVWAPKKKEDMMIGKKSNSTGSSSKRFRIRDLLYNRSNSDGKDTFLFLTPGSHHQGDQKRREKVVAPTNKKGMAPDGKKKSYLPYRQDLVAFFANVNSVSRTVRPF